MPEEAILSKIDNAISILEELQKQYLICEERIQSNQDNENGNSGLMNQVSSLKLENERLKTYIHSLEKRIKGLVDANVEEAMPPIINVWNRCILHI